MKVILVIAFTRVLAPVIALLVFRVLANSNSQIK